MNQAAETPIELTVVVPVKNEAGNTGPLAAEIHAALKGRVAYDIVFVDDGSADSTSTELAALAAADPQVRAVYLGRTVV